MFKALNLWLPSYLRRRRVSLGACPETHLIICVCDHFEPFHHATRPEGLARLRRWEQEFPPLCDALRDSTGQPLRHTFFYPLEQSDPEALSILSSLCRSTACETEIHLHHERDTAENLAATLETGKQNLASHGLLSTDPTGAIRFAFIHGNWALDNSRPDGRHCGVRNELGVLLRAGCYADFTLPSAPDPSQTATINSIYYATPSDRPKSHDRGRPARVGVTDPGGLLMVQGPLGLHWRRRKWLILPRIENADLTPRNPPTLQRLELWRDLHVHVEGRPEWIFAKLHTHGGLPRNMEMLLGSPLADFHRSLPQYAAAHPGFHYHYATAREVVNMIHAAEAGLNEITRYSRNFRYASRLHPPAP